MARATAEPIVLDPHARDTQQQARRLREEGPLVLVELPGEVVSWAVTGHEAAQQVMSDSRFAKNYRNWASYQRGEIPEGHPLLGMVQLDNMLHSDGDDHGRLRGLISKAFTPRRVRELRPQVEKLVGELLDGMEAGSGRADVKADLATPLPMGVICELFGIPEQDKLTVRELVSNVFSTVATPEEALNTQQRVNELFSGLIADKRANPGEDLTSALIGSRDENDRLSEVELLDTLWLMMAAGFETTMGALANTVRALLTHRDQLDLVRSGECSWDAVIEEGLRWDTSVASLPFRFPTEDVEIGGRTLREGEPVLVSFASANRDTEQHGDAAEDFDITRKQKRHLSFGHGVHFCLGAPLARMEMQVALAVFDDFPWADLFAPRLSAIAQPSREIGAEAVRLLLGRLEEPDRPVETRRLESQFQHRESCGCGQDR